MPVDNMLRPTTGVKEDRAWNIKGEVRAPHELLVDADGFFPQGRKSDHPIRDSTKDERARLSVPRERLWVEAAADETLVCERMEPLRTHNNRWQGARELWPTRSSTVGGLVSRS